MKMNATRCRATQRLEAAGAAFICNRPLDHDGPHSGSTWTGKGRSTWPAEADTTSHDGGPDEQAQSASRRQP